LETLTIQVLEFQGKTRANPLEHLSDASFLGKLLVLPATVRLDWKVIARYKPERGSTGDPLGIHWGPTWDQPQNLPTANALAYLAQETKEKVLYNCAQVSYSCEGNNSQGSTRDTVNIQVLGEFYSGKRHRHMWKYSE
jgi:hypothetical protein